MIRKLFHIVVFLVAAGVSAQTTKLSTAIDTTRNKIGAQFNLTLKATVDTAAAVVFPSRKVFGMLEVIRSYPIDTVKKDGLYELVKKYGLTQFDSGKYVIPRLRVLIDKKPFFSDSIAVAVSDVAVDTLKQKMYDIKDVIAAGKAVIPWWVYVVVAVVLAGIGFLIYRIAKRKPKEKKAAEVFKTPIEKATVKLQLLEKKGLWQKGEIKDYYSELTDIARTYIEEAIHIPAMESTTSELIAGLRLAAARKHMPLAAETVENLEGVLRQADLVKFAKNKPLEFEIAEDRSKIEKTIFTLDKSIPDEIVDESEERRKQIQLMLARRKRRNRVLIAIGSAVGVVFISAVILIATKGMDYVRDNIIGHPTKDLLEEKWVTSEYGNPAISVETPKVLKRMDVDKMMSKDAMALLKEFQMFGYGSLLDNFFIMVSTASYAQETQIDLDAVIEGYLKELEGKGATNIIVKKEDYKTGQGIEGIKAYGTLSMLDQINKKSVKLYYEILYFKQNGGLQQIMVTYEEGDPYAKKIQERIMNSVELAQTAP
jgi:hypothetical protein